MGMQVLVIPDIHLKPYMFRIAVRGKVILQSQGKEFFTWHGKDFFT